MVVFFLLFVFAPIPEGYRYFFLAFVPLYIALLNAKIVRDQVLLNVENAKFTSFEKKYGVKKGFIYFSIFFILLPILLTVALIVSGVKLL